VSNPGKRAARTGVKGVHPSWRPRWLAWRDGRVYLDFTRPAVALVRAAPGAGVFLKLAGHIRAARLDQRAERVALRSALAHVRRAWLAHCGGVELLERLELLSAQHALCAGNGLYATAGAKLLADQTRSLSLSRSHAAKVSRNRRIRALPTREAADAYGLTERQVRKIKARNKVT